MVTVGNKFDAPQETRERHFPDNEYKNFVTAHMEEAAEYIPTKPRAKFWVLWVAIVIRKKTR